MRETQVDDMVVSISKRFQSVDNVYLEKSLCRAPSCNSTMTERCPRQRIVVLIKVFAQHDWVAHADPGKWSINNKRNISLHAYDALDTLPVALLPRLWATVE